MKVLVTGATGFVGSRLIPRLRAAGHQVLTVSRGVEGDYDWSPESLEKGVGVADGIVHLAGENLFGKRWNPTQKKVLVSSRVETTRQLAELAAEKGVRSFISASAIGYYGPRDDVSVDETGAKGDDFLAGLCVEWEAAVEPAREAGLAVAIVRIGVVLGLGGGALQKMLPPFRLGLGGPLGSGRQIVSWIHIDDLVDLFVFLLAQPDAEGVFNGTAPNPVTMKELSRALGRALHRPALFPVPGFLLKLALGEVADVLLTGQTVEPSRALEAGFEFRHETIGQALDDLLR